MPLIILNKQDFIFELFFDLLRFKILPARFAGKPDSGF